MSDEEKLGPSNGGQHEGARAQSAFEFWGCTEIRESLNIRANDERDLLERLETVPADSVYFHTVRSLLRHRVVPMPYANDFADWVAVEMRDPLLAERLALPSPFDFPDVESLRQALVTVLDDHLSRLAYTPRLVSVKPFPFRVGHLTAVPLDMFATDLAGFRAGLAEVEESSIYYHVVEAAGRLGNPRGDFATWLGDTLGLTRAAQRIREVDPFVASLEQVRRRLLAVLDAELAERTPGGGA